MDFISRPSRETSIFIIVAVLYLLSGFLAPIDQHAIQTFNYTGGQYRILSFLVKLPIVIVWAIAFFSYRKMQNYAQSISDSEEGLDYERLRQGMRWLAWGLPIPGVISTILVALTGSGHAYSASLIFVNYLYVIVSIVAFCLIGDATHGLTLRNHVRLSPRQLRGLVAVFVTFSVMLCFLTADRLHGHSAGNTLNAFYLPNILVWLTLIAPYLFAWFVGLYAAMEIVSIARHTSGIIYRQALQFMMAGVLVIIIGMIMLQYFRSIIPRTGHFALNGALLTSYAIYFVYGIGWLLLLVGTYRLKRIEDV